MSRHSPALTQREREINLLIQQGLTNRQIAHTLDIAEGRILF